VLTSIGQDKPDKSLQLDSYLNKPVKPAQLHQNIANILHGDGGNYTAAGEIIHPPFAGGTLRLLVVEDNKVNQTVALRMLQKLGFSADLAGDGQEALTKTEQTEYDLILMDIQMPGMNGLEATRAIREKYKEQKQRPLIIGMTAHAANEERERGLAAGMDDYLTKPIQLVKLKEVLWKVQELKAS
jgi:two-component system, sensor histidine kinase and response regulator